MPTRPPSSILLAEPGGSGNAASARENDSQNAEQVPKGEGVIAGLVLGERQEPVAHATVQAFPAETVRGMETSLSLAFPARASGSATTGPDGRFRISGLPSGRFVVAAATQFLSSSREDGAPLYATTFYPATLDYRKAVPVSAFDDRVTDIRIELVRVRGARVSGSAVSASGRDLRDPRAIPVLVPLLQDTEVRSIVPWALGRIGDSRAIAPLVKALDDDDPSMRVLAIYALEELNAKDAVPRLATLLNDARTSDFGAQVSGAEAARGAIAKVR
jgi:hypothetical protein